MLEENVVSAAGTTWCLDEAKLCRMIRESGFTPAKRNNQYEILAVHNDKFAPDLQVEDWSALNKNRLFSHNEDADTVSLTVTQ